MLDEVMTEFFNGSTSKLVDIVMALNIAVNGKFMELDHAKDVWKEVLKRANLVKPQKVKEV